MGRRFLPALLVAVAAIADSAGDHGVARNALLFALPFAAVAALVRFGGFLDSRERFSGIKGVPPLAVSSLVAVVGLFVLKGLLAAVPHRRRLGSFSPAKP